MPRSPVSLATLLQLAWPIVLARATQAVIGFCDAWMTAPLGQRALAAVTTGSINVFTWTILPMGTVFIVQSFAAQLRGRGELSAVVRYAHYGLLIALGAGAFSALCIPLIPPALAPLGYAPGVRGLMGDYLQIRMLAVTAVVGVEALGNWYGGLGNTRPAMLAGLVTMGVNVALNYLLIEPRFGLPGYGVQGAAWASVAASWTGLAMLGFGFAAGHGYERGAGPLGLRRTELLRVLRFGVPNGLNWFLEFAAFAAFINLVVGHLGTTALAAFNVVIHINSVSFMPAFGIASAGAILVGERIGRGAQDEVPALLRMTLAVTVGWMGSVGLGYLVAPAALLGLFGSGVPADAELVRIGALMLMLSAAWQVFDAVGITVSEALRAAGDTTWCMAARVSLAWGVFMPAGWVAVRVLDGGAATAMLAVTGYVALTGAAFSWRFRAGHWRRLELVEHRVATG